jgi:hypothetical protein
MQDFKEGQLIIYHNGDRYEIGKIKRIVDNGAFVYYSSGETAAKTPFDLMHPLANAHCISETSLGGKCPYENVCKDIDEMSGTETNRETCMPDKCERYDAIYEGAHLQ